MFAKLSGAVFLVMGLAAGEDDVLRIGPGITPPSVTRRVEPEYSTEARNNGIQGTVMLEIVVSEKGRATDITVISPMGFGLDEMARAAIEKWEFVPGKKDGHPVKILATVEVNFRFREAWFDEKAERQRSTFNLTLQTLGRAGASEGAIKAAVGRVQDLAKQNYPAGMYLSGLWQMTGEHVAKDPVAGFELMEKAAAKNYGPAIYEVTARRLEGNPSSDELAKGLESLRRAALLGSAGAQYNLGHRYETGKDVPVEIERARRYFRLCGSKGQSACQFRLGKSLLESPTRLEREYVQAVAWLQLAAAGGSAGAKVLVAQEEPKLSMAQTILVSKLKTQLVRKPGE